ncbi:GNS1/SUR4 membrane protein [Sistotremastrum niveocremeum HHB9708]|uniref:Elongation of fatty acids protein n=1 Tax=Sistotremastrum niveocremeum HHB9708 TaxID=1314777 RepID=A0A164U691_9AGAM|nr:GNS1/SUR4 membrane protein [Sistotremastrum niveocremeum HHB9708]
MANLADFILNNVPLPSIPSYLTHYEPGKTPLSQTTHVFATLIGYLVVVFSLKAIMGPFRPLKLTLLFQAHNIILSVGSGLLLALMLEEITPIVWNHGFFYGICSQKSWTPRLEFYYLINYYIKYLELIDTVFLALKKKPLAFLHVFHHSATALLCFTQLNGKTSVSWVPIVLNLTVHVAMYYYYYATAGGRKIWWKKYLTSMQITQFVIDLFVVYFASYSYFVSSYFRDILPARGSCSGTESAAIFGCALLTSYLFLFIHFYIQTYKKPASAKGKGKANGHANGNGNGVAHSYKTE